VTIVPQIRVNKEGYDNIKALAEKSGYTMSYLLEELGKLNDFVPDNADRITLGIFPRVENRSVLFICAPVYCGKLPACKNSVSDKEVDKRIKKALMKKVKI